MSLLAGIAHVWAVWKDARALRRQGVTDPQELRRRLLERSLQRLSGESIAVQDVEVPDEAWTAWEDYDPFEQEALEIEPGHVELLLLKRWLIILSKAR